MDEKKSDVEFGDEKDQEEITIQTIIEMEKKDKEMRSPQYNYTSQEILNNDREHLKKLKRYITVNGFDEISKNMQAYNAAWLIVQHIHIGDEEELSYMEEYLELLEVDLHKTEVQDQTNKEEIINKKRKVAYLTDRLRLYKDEPQLYGTQFTFDSDGKTVVYKIEGISDPYNLTAEENRLLKERRKNMGFKKTFSEYRDSIN